VCAEYEVRWVVRLLFRELTPFFLLVGMCCWPPCCLVVFFVLSAETK
jgi:hypothetical protein